MEIGRIFLHKHKSAHGFSQVAILHDYNTNRRYLYDFENGCRIGEYNLLYAKITDAKLTKTEIRKYTKNSGGSLKTG